MDRKAYEPTQRQQQKWAALAPAAMPTDDEFKSDWARHHHGTTRGWGLGKRQWIIQNLSNHREYQLGLWQGRVDAARGLDYQEPHTDDENANAFNLGYHRGYTSYASDRNGWDQTTRQQFDQKYLEVTQ